MSWKSLVCRTSEREIALARAKRPYFGISVDELIDHKVKPRGKPLEVKSQTVTITLSPEEAIELKKLLAERAEGRVDAELVLCELVLQYKKGRQAQKLSIQSLK